MAIYWEGSKKISKAQYDVTRAKQAAWTGPKVVDAPIVRQPSGKQPRGDTPLRMPSVPSVPSAPKYRLISEGEYKAEQQVPFAWTPPKLPSGKQPVDTDTLLRLQVDADHRKLVGEQPAVAATHGKEIVFEFSKPISSKANTYVSKLVKLLGGKRSYIEDQTKLVVVM